jgi:hypothetical protein
MSDMPPQFPEGAGQLLHALLAPPSEPGPPYTHTFASARCTACDAAGDPECRDGLLYRDGGEALDYANVYLGRCSHSCQQPKPSYTVTEAER